MSGFDAMDDMGKLSHVNSLVYKQQAIWFLNAFWSQGPKFGENSKLREEIWTYHKTCVELDRTKKENGNELNEFDSHRLLEKSDDALTVTKMREVLKEIDVDFNKMVSLTEFLIYKFAVDWKVLVNAPQGCDMGAINEAQAALENANKMLQYAISASERSKEDAILAKKAEEHAVDEETRSAKAAVSAKAAEEALKEAKAQNEAALAELHAQEAAIAKKLADLQLIADDENLGAVKKGKAKAEIAMCKAEDPMPLRMAKIHQEAAVRKVTKATVKAGTTTMAAEVAAKEAVKARAEAANAAVEAAAAAQAAEEAIPAAQQAFADAEAILDTVKSKNTGGGQGQIFYIDRELEEAKKYMPRSKVAKAEAEAAAAKAAAEAKSGAA